VMIFGVNKVKECRMMPHANWQAYINNLIHMNRLYIVA